MSQTLSLLLNWVPGAPVERGWYAVRLRLGALRLGHWNGEDEGGIR